MYISSNMCRNNDKSNSDKRCNNQIFRPWDNVNKCFANPENTKTTPQDSTVSTTTVEETEKIKDIITNVDTSVSKSSFQQIKKPSMKPDKTILDNFQQQSSHSKSLINFQNSSLDYSLDSYNALYPSDILQSNLASSLGLPSGDPLLLESVAQGFALEEYARVLNQEHQAKILAAKKQRPKKYKCPHCDVGFSNNGQLKGHIRIHTGERPFKCDAKDCGKTFTRNEELTRHKRIHSGLRPFPCTHCGKRFGRKDHLKKHSRTHFQPRGVYAVPVMLPYDTWATAAGGYPFVPMFGY